MPISTIYVPETFQGDGISTAFAITFPYQLSTDILVQKTVVATGVVTTLVLGTDYSVTPANNSPANTGTVTMLTGAVPSGTDLTISRAVPLTQLTTWVPNDPNPSTAVMNAVDKLTMQVQDFNYLYGGRSWYLRPTDIDGQGAFDARKNRGTNLADPITGTDAVTVNYLQSYINAIVLTGSTTVAPVFTFTGDGATTSFQLAGVTISFASGFQVSIDGLIQAPTADYTIALSSPPTINFTSAPPNGTKIVIVVRGFSAPSAGGVATAASFLRGDGVYANTLIGAGGVASIPTDSTQLFDAQQVGSDSAIRVTTDSTHVGYLRFGVSGSGNLFNSAIGYNPANAATGFYSRSNPVGALSSFYDNGNVYLARSLFVGFGGNVGIGTQTPAFPLDVVGNVNITGRYTGNAAGSLITSGQVLPQFLASNAPASSLFLRGDGVWALPAGGGGSGGFNTTTTATFVIAAVSSSQTVAVASATGVNTGNYVYISDGTHTIVGQVTGIAGLNLTVVTTSIVAGVAGNTMGSGAAASLSGVPGQNTVLVSDQGTSATQATTLNFTSQLTSATGIPIDTYIHDISAGVATVKGYLSPNISASFDSVLVSTHGINSTSWLLASTPGVLVAGSNGYINWGNLNAQYISANSGTASSTTYLRGDNSWSGITPASLVYTGSAPVAGQVPSYNSSGQFQWVNSAGGGVPAGGTTAQFLRGDQTWSGTLSSSTNTASVGYALSAGSGSTAIQSSWASYLRATGVSSVWGTFASQNISWTTFNAGYGAQSGIDAASFFQVNGTLLLGQSSISQPTGIDAIASLGSFGYQVESIICPGTMARFGGVRTMHGPWQFAYTITTTSGAVTVDLANGAYQRITPTGAITFTINDTTPVPTLSGWQFASELTLEITGTVTVTWPGSVTWANGASAPTLSSGVNIIRLIKRQGVAGWIGYAENLAAGGYSDAQARTAVLQSTYLIGTSTVAVNVTAGASATFSIPSGGVGTTQLANSAVTVAKISATGTPSSTTYLRGDGAWTTPSAATGQAAIQFQVGGSNQGSPGAITTLNLTGAVGTPNLSGGVSLQIPVGISVGSSAFVSPTYTGVSRIDFGSGFTMSSAGGGEVTVTATGGGGGGSQTIAAQANPSGALVAQVTPNAGGAPVTLSPQPTTTTFGRGLNVSNSGGVAVIALSQNWFNIVDYGADPTGAADSTSAINAAIAAASGGSASNGTVYIPTGQYKISSTLNISASINIRGDGCAFRNEPVTSGFPNKAASQLLWYGAAGGTMIKLNPQASGSSSGGFIWENFGVDCRHIAYVGIRIRTCSASSFRNISVLNHVGASAANPGVGIDLNTDTSGYSVCLNKFDNIYISAFGDIPYAASFAIGMRMDSTAPDGSDAFGNTFGSVFVVHNYIGIYLGNCDNNTFTYVQTYSPPGAPTTGGQPQSCYATTNCRQNRFFGYIGAMVAVNGADVYVASADAEDVSNGPSGAHVPPVYCDASSYVMWTNTTNVGFYPRGTWYYSNGSGVGHVNAIYSDDCFYSPNGNGSQTYDLYIQSKNLNGGNPLRASRINFT